MNRMTEEGQFDLSRKGEHTCPMSRCGAKMYVEIVNFKRNMMYCRDHCDQCGHETEVYGIDMSPDEIDEVRESIRR